jgi:hypothetical protein
MTENNQVSPRPPIHVLLTGDTGAGKDSLAATFPGPRLVWHLDGFGQEMAYMHHVKMGRARDVGELKEYSLGNSKITYRDIVDARGDFTRIEYYSSDSPTAPNIAQVLEQRMGFFKQEAAQWKTLICGSLSSASLEGRLYEQYVLNPQFKDPRKWHGAATDYLERMVMMQKSLPINVVFICHVANHMDNVLGEMFFMPDLPGRLSYGAPRYFNEMYRVYVYKDDQGVNQRAVQTDSDGQYKAKTHIFAPNPCFADYEALWVNWGK